MVRIFVACSVVDPDVLLKLMRLCQFCHRLCRSPCFPLFPSLVSYFPFKLYSHLDKPDPILDLKFHRPRNTLNSLPISHASFQCTTCSSTQPTVVSIFRFTFSVVGVTIVLKFVIFLHTNVLALIFSTRINIRVGVLLQTRSSRKLYSDPHLLSEQ
jgi:hypothetical protein